MPGERVTITSVEFRNYKAFAHYSLKLQGLNILVGPNNTGKSTILGAFRTLETAIRHARSKNPEILDGPQSEVYGYRLADDSIPISLENIHTDYAEEYTTIVFRLSNNNRLQLFFPEDGGCILIPLPHDKLVRNTRGFKDAFPISIAVVPVLGPVEHREKLVREETVLQNIYTHRASRNFRNYWYHFPVGFNEFAELIRKTWPGMEVKPPELNDAPTSELIMFCLENRITRELYWSGFGFQVWCQLLTHVSRAQDASLLIVDEPDVYLHPDLQRQLLGLLRSTNADVLLATHSTEVISEADPSEIVLIDKRHRSAQRLRDIEGVQTVLSNIGSIQNITLTRLANNRRVLFVEGESDYSVLRGFARQLGLIQLASGVEVTPVESGGFASWERVRALGWGVEKTLGKPLRIGAIYDRDYASNEEIAHLVSQLSAYVSLAHVHKRKELENYLLVPSVLDRTAKQLIIDQARRLEKEGFASKAVTLGHGEIESILDAITEPQKSRILALYIGRRNDFLRQTHKDTSTVSEETINWFNERWSDLHRRLEIVPGKEVLAALRDELQSRYGISLTTSRIVRNFTVSEIPGDLVKFLQDLEHFRKSNS